MNGFLALLRLETRLLFVRGLPRILFIAVVAIALLHGLTGTDQEGQGWQRIASGVRTCSAVLIAMLAVLGGLSIAGDAQEGALRAVLMRPVGRARVLASRGVVLVVFGILLYGLGVGILVLCARLGPGLGDVRLPDYPLPLLPEADIAAHTWRLGLACLPAILAAPLLGLCASVLLDDASSTVVLALLATLGPLLFGTLAGELPDWVFIEGVRMPAALLVNLAEGITTEEGAAQGPALWTTSAWWPFVWAAGSLLLATIVFKVREIRA